jgi:hypothetical protein
MQGQLNEPQGLCSLNNPLHKAVDWNNNGIIDALPVSYPGDFSFDCPGQNISSDHDDYAALQLDPTTPSNGGPPLPPPEPSGACPPLPELHEGN